MPKLLLGTCGPVTDPWQATARCQMTPRHIEMKSGEPAAVPLLHFTSLTHHALDASISSAPHDLPSLEGPGSKPTGKVVVSCA